LLAEMALASGKYIQAFPEYGPERMGAPVTSFNRISSSPIRLHSGVINPDIVIVLDPTLMDSVDVAEGITADGTLIVNTERSPIDIRNQFKIDPEIKVCTVDAFKISTETIGREIPNTPMLGALVKVTDILDFKDMIEGTRKKLEKKFKTKPEVIEGNLKAIERAHSEVRTE
jgi:pyruvate ferredoxin oxidoreductase gamma subunit